MGNIPLASQFNHMEWPCRHLFFLHQWEWKLTNAEKNGWNEKTKNLWNHHQRAALNDLMNSYSHLQCLISGKTFNYSTTVAFLNFLWGQLWSPARWNSQDKLKNTVRAGMYSDVVQFVHSCKHTVHKLDSILRQSVHLKSIILTVFCFQFWKDATALKCLTAHLRIFGHYLVTIWKFTD